MRKRFNLLSLHSAADIHPRTWISVRGPKTKHLVKELEKDVLGHHALSREGLSRKIAAHFNCAHGVVKRILQGNTDFYPIPILLELSKLSKHGGKSLEKMQKDVTHLKVNSASASPVKAAHTLTNTLAKILGAFMADGSLSIQHVFAAFNENGLAPARDTLGKLGIRYSRGYMASRKQHYISVQAGRESVRLPDTIQRSNELHLQTHYSIELTEEYKDNVEAFTRWIYEEFGIRPTSFNTKKGAWRVIFSNKILARYLVVFFDAIPGPKTYTAREPAIIRNSSLTKRKHFARGAIMFDGSVTQYHKIAFTTKSRSLCAAIEDIWTLDQIAHGKYVSQIRNEMNMVTKSGNSENRLIFYFEPGTQKYKLLHWQNGGEQYQPILKERVGLTYAKLLDEIRAAGTCDTNFLVKRFSASHTHVRMLLKTLQKQKRIRMSRSPRSIGACVSANAEVLLTGDAHSRVFDGVRAHFGRDKNCSEHFGIHKATFSAWRRRKNRIPIRFLRQLSPLISADFEKLLQNIKETDREIITVA